MIGFGQNVYIPDAGFKAYLVGEPLINTNGDTEIQVSEASAFNESIDCSGINISNLTGIEGFTALAELYCNFNNLTSDYNYFTKMNFSKIIFTYSKHYNISPMNQI